MAQAIATGNNCLERNLSKTFQNGRRKRDKGGVKSASVCLCVETDAFLRLKINAANNFVDDADQTEVSHFQMNVSCSNIINKYF